MRVIKAALVVLVLSLGLAAPVGALTLKDYDDGVDAYDRGDYETAYRLLRPFVNPGHAWAQHNLGNMNYFGQGVPEDYAEAARWWHKAAEQGEPRAQNNLGAMYLKGEGVLQDYVQAHMWFNLAASTLTGELRGEAVEHRDDIAAEMTPAQLAEAHKLAREWRPASER